MTMKTKVAVVTGSGGRGCGRAIALRFAREGAAVMVADIDLGGGEETLRLLRAAGARAAFCRADVGSEDQVGALFAYAEAELGGVDVLVNNASAPFAPGAPMTEWLNPITVDLLGALYTTRFAVEAMRRYQIVAEPFRVVGKSETKNSLKKVIGGTVAGGVVGAIAGNTSKGLLLGAVIGSGVAVATKGWPHHIAGRPAVGDQVGRAGGGDTALPGDRLSALG
jgi:NAD(P)-dependent dehydrogenase (short-subunit alcohol dehydrogenase family)